MSVGSALAAIPARAVVRLIRFYQRWISPLFPGACRFSPSCSEYTRQAVLRYGVFRGWLLAWADSYAAILCTPGDMILFPRREPVPR